MKPHGNGRPAGRPSRCARPPWWLLIGALAASAAGSIAPAGMALASSTAPPAPATVQAAATTKGANADGSGTRAPNPTPALRDPMQAPQPAAPAPTAAEAGGAEPSRLPARHLIVIEGCRYLVDRGRRLSVGDRLEGARIEAIDESAITLREAGALRRLPLYGSADKRTSASPITSAGATATSAGATATSARATARSITRADNARSAAPRSASPAPTADARAPRCPPSPAG